MNMFYNNLVLSLVNYRVFPAIWWLLEHTELYLNVSKSLIHARPGGSVSGSDLQVPGLVVQWDPGAEEGLGRLRVVVGPAELPPLHRVRGRSQARFHVEKIQNFLVV